MASLFNKVFHTRQPFVTKPAKVCTLDLPEVEDELFTEVLTKVKPEDHFELPLADLSCKPSDPGSPKKPSRRKRFVALLERLPSKGSQMLKLRGAKSIKEPPCKELKMSKHLDHDNNGDVNSINDDHDDICSSTTTIACCSSSTASSEQHRPEVDVSAKSGTDNVSQELLPEEECDIPTFLHTKNCDPELIAETRRLLRERYAKNPDSFYEADYERMLADDWTVSRFLLRRRCDPKRSAKLMEDCGKFRKLYKMSEVQLWEFPCEFHQAGAMFQYARDRVGNVTCYMRCKMYRRVPELSDVFKAFILCVIEACDTTNNGRGVAVIFDLTGCGLQNVDLGFLSWLLTSFRNYCPKGVSYIVVYNLPWFLNATAKLAMSWMSATNKRSLRFASGDEIRTFIAPENLPDYMGGTCKLNYRAVPEGSRPSVEVCERLDMSPAQALKIKDMFKQYLEDDDGNPIGESTGTKLSDGDYDDDDDADTDRAAYEDTDSDSSDVYEDIQDSLS